MINFLLLVVMTMSKTRHNQIMLLLAVYLFAVLSHFCILRPLALASVKLGLVESAPADKLTDKSGRNGIKLKKIAKTVVNRNGPVQKAKVQGLLHVATLLHHVLFARLHDSRAVNYAAPFIDLPIKRLYPLRI